MTVHELFDPLAAIPTGDGPKARVAITLNSTSLGYGEGKVSATISLECTQTEEAVNMASDLAYQKAKDICQTVFSDWAKVVRAEREKNQ